MTSQRDDLYKGYLEEMQALENFRVTYTSAHPGAGVEREDPDVRRLIDAMAFFTARTRASVTRNLLATQRRMFEQYFSYLLSPMPATAFVQAVTTGRFADTAVLPRGSELVLTPEGAPGALFHTLSDLRLLPIQLESIETLLRSRSGFRIVLTFRARFPRNDEVETIRLLVSHLDDYKASLGVTWELRKHLEGASVVFGDDKVDDLTEGSPCVVSWGAEDDPDALPDLTHPLQQLRESFHFPQRELFMNVKVQKSPAQWKEFRILLDLDAGWPRNLRLNAEMFQMNVVPVANLKRASAAPILCDGKKDRYPIRHSEVAPRFSLHSIVGVYEIAEGGMLSPLKPGILKGGSGSYELERTPGGDFLILDFPEAFSKSKKVTVDGFWVQPWLSDRLGGKLRLALASRNIAGVQLELRGAVRPHWENKLGADFDRMLRLLALRSKTVGFDRDDIVILLESLGTVESSPFRDLPKYLTDMKLEAIQLPREAGGQRHIYKLALGEVDRADRPLVETAFAKLVALLRLWTHDAEVFLEVKIEGEDELIEL